jgi:hypothetical protein
MERDIRNHLIHLARQGRTTTYDVMNTELQLGLDFHGNKSHRTLVGEWLGNISEWEYLRDRPLISALVIHAQDHRQGDGFYLLCERLLGRSAAWYKRNISFERGVIQECFQYWQNNAHYTRFGQDFA